MKNFETFREQLELEGYVFLASTTSTDKTASLTLRQKHLHGDECELLFYTNTLEDGTVVNISILVSTPYGYSSEPIEGGILGKRTGELHLNSILSQLPPSHTDKQLARNYLAKNPEMLISMLTNTLNTQKDIISEQEGVIQDAEWYINCMFSEAGLKMKKFMKFSLPMLMRVKGYWGKVKEEFDK